MPDVLFVSKPIAPPWTDSNKNLVRDVARALTRYRPRVMVPEGEVFSVGVSEAVYKSAGAYAPSRWTNARVLGRLLRGPHADVWHFFFAPNPLTLRAGAWASKFKNIPTVHTIASAPDNLEAVAPLLFAGEIVTLSRHTTERLQRVGVSATRIPPALEAPVVTPEAIANARAHHGLPERYVLYPGDLEHSDGAMTFVRAAARAPELSWVIAARPKTPRATVAREVLAREAVTLGAKVLWLGEIPDIHAVVAGAMVTTLVTDTLHAKMDLPLVLLESMALGVPVMVGAGTASDELMEGGAVAVVPGDPVALAEDVLRLAGDGDRRASLGETGARWVQTTCHPTVIAEAYQAVYDRVRRHGHGQG